MSVLRSIIEAEERIEDALFGTIMSSKHPVHGGPAASLNYRNIPEICRTDFQKCFLCVSRRKCATILFDPITGTLKQAQILLGIFKPLWKVTHLLGLVQACTGKKRPQVDKPTGYVRNPTSELFFHFLKSAH
jgi:hypothetical protein